MFIYCLVQPAWYICGCLCVCKRVQWGGGWSGEEMSSLACAPSALADQGEKKERFVSKIRSLKSELFSTDLQPCAPGKETITLPLNTHSALKKWPLKINLNERGERGKSDACLFFSAFLILCNHRDFAHSQFCCLPWQVTFFCCC